MLITFHKQIGISPLLPFLTLIHSFGVAFGHASYLGRIIRHAQREELKIQRIQERLISHIFIMVLSMSLALS